MIHVVTRSVDLLKTVFNEEVLSSNEDLKEIRKNDQIELIDEKLIENCINGSHVF